MASFIGTNQEFRRYIGPRLRNLVQQITKNHKISVGKCEHCSTTDNLESAHIAGRDRNDIIDLVLTKYTSNNIITVDIAVFEKKFKDEHNPIEKSILILCKSCHRKYDSKNNNTNIGISEQPLSINITQTPQKKPDSEGYLPIILEPSDPVQFKRELLLAKAAEIETHYSDGTIRKKPWDASRFKLSSNVMGNLRSRPEYRSGNWQAHGIVKVHVRILKNS